MDAVITTTVPPLIVIVNEQFGAFPEEAKDGLFFFVTSFFVISTIVSTLFSAAFLVFSVMLWSHFKPMRFFWFLSQLTISVFILSAGNLLINVPATLSLLSKEAVNSDVVIFLAYLIDFCHYSIIFSNLVIAIQRGFVFFLRRFSDKVFDPPVIYIWLTIVWIFSIIVEFILLSSECRYEYDEKPKTFRMHCGTSIFANPGPPIRIQILDFLLRIVIPILIFLIYLAIVFRILYLKKSPLNKKETLILKQAIFGFLVFQASPLIFLIAQHVQISNVTAFLVKRFVNTMEIFAGAATPSFFFLTSKEVRKFLLTRVSASSSQGGSNQVRGLRSLDRS